MLLAVVITISVPTHAQPHQKPTAAELQADMRKLWEDHITWTRNVILNIIDELPGTTEAVNRLLQNQVDIGAAIKPFYGEAAGNQLTTLLTAHITIAAEILTALDDGNTTALNDALARWNANADAIAAFLSAANPAWPLTEMKAMMHEHLDLTTQEAVARKTANYAADAAAYDAVHLEILKMADMLTAGIVAQFPNRFRGGCPVTTMHESDHSMNIASLEQNAPNPFSDKTVITYYIPEGVRQAELVLYNERGTIAKRLLLPARGTGSITLYTAGLQKGLYTYSILADGNLADSKKMIYR